MRRRPSWVLRRRVLSARFAAAASVVLLALCSVASSLTWASRPEHEVSRSPRNITARPRMSGRAEPSGNQVSDVELADARAVATRFLAGYLPFVYGRAPVVAG